MQVIFLMRRQSNVFYLVISFLPPILVGIVSGFLIRNDVRNTFQFLRKPPLTPPAILFPIVWTILYLLMGLATYLIYQSHSYPEEKKKALFPFYVQLILNFMWSPIFFSLGLRGLALIVLLVLTGVTLVTTLYYNQIDRRAGLLLSPYVVWLVFALYLNIGFVILN